MTICTQQDEVLYQVEMLPDDPNNAPAPRQPHEYLAMDDDPEDPENGGDNSEEERIEGDTRTSSEIKRAMAKRMYARRFDIKQLKAEIWKILEPRIPMYQRRAEQSYKQGLASKENNYTFVGLCDNLNDMVHDEALVQNMSV